MSVAGLRPGLGRGGTIHSLLVRVIGGEVTPGEDTVDAGIGFIHSEGGLPGIELADEPPGVNVVAEDIERRMNDLFLNSTNFRDFTSRYSTAEKVNFFVSMRRLSYTDFRLSYCV